LGWIAETCPIHKMVEQNSKSKPNLI